MNAIELVTASAGSGKTFRLTETALEAVKDGMRPDRLVATTFTRKAAADLEERLRQKLLVAGKADMADLLSDGFVGTVNSVCARLISEYAIDAGLSPAMDVIPDADAKLLFNQAVSQAIAKHSETLEPVAYRLNRRGGGNSYNKFPDWREDVKKIAELARGNRIGEEALLKCGDRSWKSYREMLGKVDKRVTPDGLLKVARKAVAAIDPDVDDTNATRDALSALRELLEFESTVESIPWSLWAKFAKVKPGAKSKAVMAEVNECATKWLGSAGFHEDVEALIRGVFACAAAAMRQYDAYKRERGLVDFIDQETQVLDLIDAKKNPADFQKSLKERLSLLLVDEFQDTSPMQLAIFLALGRLLERSVWVGDPKQAIYGFRGTAPELMRSVVAGMDQKKVDSLPYSWRSREKLVDFANAVFERAFHDMPRKQVSLGIDAKRKAKAKGGILENWLLVSTKKDDDAARLALGVRELLLRKPAEKPALKPTDIAILCRVNSDCQDMANALEAFGIRASTARGSLTDAPECRITLAALRYVFDGWDTLAMAELARLSPEIRQPGGWLGALAADRDGTIAAWREMPLFQRLEAGRENLGQWTPLEALEFAITASRVTQTVKHRPNPSLARANLDALRGVCVGYLDQCRSRRASAGIAGFIRHLWESNPGQAEGMDENAVRVLTYHGSKGLEWPVVILYSLDSKSRASAFEIRAGTDGEFDPRAPLSGRRIHFWPDPIPGKQKSDELDALLAKRDEQIRAQQTDRDERRRLLYVGITRARDRLVFAVRKNEKGGLDTAWLGELADKDEKAILELPAEAGKPGRTSRVSIGKESFDFAVREYTKNMTADPLPAREKTEYLTPEVKKRHAYSPARVSPSDLSPDKATATAILAMDFGGGIPTRGKPDYALIGKAVHGFLGMDQGGRDGAGIRSAADGLLRRFGVSENITPDALVTIRDRLLGFLAERYPGTAIRREWPVFLRENDHQVMQGWMDMLLETPDGFVIIDHKTYPGGDAEEHAREYAPQLAAYRRAITAATWRKVIALLVHMPIAGMVYELRIEES